MIKVFKHRYGVMLPFQMDRQRLEWMCFVAGRTPEEGGLGRAQHFKNAFALTWPHVEVQKDLGKGKIIRNHWTDRIVEAACNDELATRRGNSIFRSVVLSGCGAAGKSHTAARFGMAWWQAEPWDSIFIMTSTTRDQIRRRLWPILTTLHSTMVDKNGRKVKYGHLVDSRMEITYETEGGSKDAKHAIFAMAVAAGETQKAVNNLKGLHARRMLLVIDEANGTPEGIFSVIPNYRIACEDFTVIIIGNPLSRLDNHGRALEPVDGWSSINAESLSWRTKRVPEWDLDSGIALRFDGADSPNVHAGKDVFPYIYPIGHWEAAKKKGENTLAFWTQDRGLHPPEGSLEAVLNETALMNADVHSQLQFFGARTPCAFVDPAYGGDKAVVVFGECGEIEAGLMALQIVDRIEIGVMTGAGVQEPDLQVAIEFVEMVRDRGIRPENTGVDATGTGRGVYAFVVSLLGKDVMRFETSEKPGDAPVMEGDRRAAHEVYTDRLTESWVRVGSLVRTGQLKGMNHQAQEEFTQRQIETPRIARGRQRLEPKPDFKRRLGRSPDDADAIAGLADLAAKRLGLLVNNPGRATSVRDEWREFEKKWQLPYLDEGAQVPIGELEFDLTT